jgi:glycosyltransferase 2 family protein
MSNQASGSLLKKVSPAKIIFPMIIGLGVVAYMFYNEFDPEAFSLIEFTVWSAIWLFFALVMMAFRDIGYMIRLRILTDGKLKWKSIFNIIMLWEFTSAITPSAIGGTSIATYFIHKEGLTVGRSTAVVLATSILDELYFVLLFPLLFLFVSPEMLFTIGDENIVGQAVDFTNRYFYFAVIGYFLKLFFVLLIIYGLFFNPKGIKWLLVTIFKLPILRKLSEGAEQTGSDLIVSSAELKNKSLVFWLKAFGASVLSWTSRYWVVNCLLLAFFFVDNHMLIFARQFVMWIMMLVIPTPGGSGFAEYIFRDYLGEFINPVSLAVSVALLWRLITYYIYLIAGAIIIPRWVKKVTEKNESTQ